MREIVLDSKRYRISGEIQRRNVNPMAARVDTGAPGWASFTEATVEEWHGMRGGIGKKYQEGSNTERSYWSEGLNTTLDGAIIPGPKINTAGTFGDDAYTAWAASTVYASGVFIKATTYNNHIYECTTGGTSGAAEPDPWGTTDAGTTNDNTAVWTCRSVEVVRIFDFAGSTYAVAQNVIAKWNTGTSKWDAKETGLADPIDAIVVTDETATYAVVSSASAAKKTTDGTSWSALTGCKGYLTVFDSRLMGFYGQTVNYSPHGDIDGTWATFKVSEYLGTVHGIYAGKLLASDEPALFLHCSVGWFVIDFWYQIIYPLDDYSGYTYCGKAGCFWNSSHWVATGGGIKKYAAGGAATEVGPDQDDGLPSTYQGAIYDMLGTVDESWLVYCVNGGSAQKSSILKRHGTIGGNQQVYTTSAINNPIRCLHYSPSNLYTNGRLWWGEGITIKYCMMPDFNADPTEISGYEFATTSGKCIFSIFRPLTPFNKLAIKAMATTKNCSATKYWTLYYDINESGSWTTFDTFKSSPHPTDLDFGSGAGSEFRTIQFAVASTSNSATSVPQLRSLLFGFQAFTKRLRSWTFTVRAEGRDAEALLTNLHTSQDKDTLLLFYPSGDTGKTSYRVKIESLPENVHWDNHLKEGEVQVIVKEIFRG